MLMMSNVKPMEYLLGIGAYVFVFCMAVCCLWITGEILPAGAVDVSAAECMRILISSVIGALIGVVSDIRRLPAVCPFLPCCLLPLFPCCQCLMPPIRNVGKFLYSQQIYEQINNSSTIVLSAQSFVVILINFALVLVLYVYMYRKKQLLAS